MKMYTTEYVRHVPETDTALRPSMSNPGRNYRWYQDAVFLFGYYTNFSVAVGLFPAAFSTQALMGSCAETYLDRCPLAPLPINPTNTTSVRLKVRPAESGRDVSFYFG